MTSTTNPRRYQDDLRRIVGIDEGARGLAPADPKPRIPGARGIAYTTESGGSATASGNAPSDGSAGTKVPTGASDGSNESGNDGLSSNGSFKPGIDGANPNDFSRPVEESELSVDRLFDGSIGLGGSLPLLRAVDCDSGKELELIFEGGFIPPEGWETPDTPPGDNWDGIVRYNRSTGPGCTGQQPAILDIGKTPEDVLKQKQSRTCGSVTLFLNSSKTQIGVSSGSLNDQGIPVGGFYNISSHNCQTPPPPGEAEALNAFCANPPPVNQLWPEDNIIQLARQEDGTWITSERDPDVTTQYTQPLSSFEFCDSQGNRYRPIPGRDGDLVIVNQGTGDFYVRNSEGTVYAFGSASAIKNYTAPAALGEVTP